MRKPATWAVALCGIVAPAAGVAAAGDDVAGAGAACVARLAEIANRPESDIKVLTTVPDDDGFVITLDLAGAEAAWLCHVDAAGNVVDVSYQGEG